MSLLPHMLWNWQGFPGEAITLLSASPPHSQAHRFSTLSCTVFILSQGSERQLWWDMAPVMRCSEPSHHSWTLKGKFERALWASLLRSPRDSAVEPYQVLASFGTGLTQQIVQYWCPHASPLWSEIWKPLLWASDPRNSSFFIPFSISKPIKFYLLLSYISSPFIV